MEQTLNCNVQECGSQLTDRAVVTAPYTCPACRQPLSGSEVCEQLLHPSEEWKSVALCGLSPTAVMECAGRALSFWSYQMTNQISYQIRKNAKLKDYCAELQGEMESMWEQANQRISTLSSRIRDMEREEDSLRRKCEELSFALTNRTKELAQSQELYSKLKQRALSQNQNISPGISGSRSPLRTGSATETNYRHSQTQLPRPIMPVGSKVGASNYFPTSPKSSTTQPNSTAIVEWNKPRFSQREYIMQSDRIH
ncbi:hypothetical protein N656DRAFT_791442 [Canariomyces notabilis]|uniref:E3 ubiquitin-protein ligase CCNB1IP1 n=1 Tax=Canariomyces notabilis TaxID=2074819 RepID=A0AAN6TAI2_9PEZI|nr:hypothetical protein N656DRAFT_791442 [Canariomyces arenarius]